MAMVGDSRKPVRRRVKEKENTQPETAHNSTLDGLLGDSISNILGRRSDVGKRSLIPVDNDESHIDVEINNDEKEKKERKEREKQEREKKEKEKAATVKKTGFNILSSLTQDELDEHYSKCIKLCNQNKVNTKNAFKLQLIDYMKIICMNQPTKSENLTLMSCTLGASSKIYSFRVDKVYSDMVKIVSGKGFEIQNDDSEDEGQENDAVSELKKSKKKRRGHESESEDETGELDEVDKKLDMEKMLCKDKDTQKSGKGQNDWTEWTTLPKGLEHFLDCKARYSDLKIHLNPPVFPIYEITEFNSTVNLKEPYYIGTYERLDPADYIKNYNDIRKAYSLIGNDGEEDTDVNMNSSLAFDPLLLNCSLRLEEEEDEDVDCGDGFAPDALGADYDDDEADPLPEHTVNGLMPGQVSSIQPQSFSAESMIHLVSTKPGDYSYFDNSRLDFWAGPTHWRVKRGNARERNHRITDTQKKINKKAVSIDFTSDNFQNAKKEAYSEVCVPLTSKTISTWSKNKCRQPQSLSSHKDTNSIFCFMKNNKIPFVKKDSILNLLCTEDKNNLEESVLHPDDFSGRLSDDEQCNGEPDDRDDDSNFDGALSAGDKENPSCNDVQENGEILLNNDVELLPAPPKVNKIIIKYAKAQKRIDIKLLKSVIWDTLALTPGETPGEEKIKEVKFSDIYASLANKLPNDDAAELSFPIAFMALLHMSNEKCLSLRTSDENDEVYVSLDES